MTPEKNPLLEKTTCPKCKSALDAATNVESPKLQPKAGDVTVCLYCSSILIYKTDFLLRKATKADLRKLNKETLHALLEAQALSKIISKKFKKK